MSLLFLLLLLSPTADITKVPPICIDLAGILQEAVEGGYVTINEAGDVIARCARAPRN